MDRKYPQNENLLHFLFRKCILKSVSVFKNKWIVFVNRLGFLPWTDFIIWESVLPVKNQRFTESARFLQMWKKQIELVPYRATKISRKTPKHIFFPLIAKLVCFSCVFCVRLREMSQKIQGKRVIHLSILNEYLCDWDTNDLQTKMKFRRTLYLLTN